MFDLAPIALFVYNRPWHTEQTLLALMANALAEKSTLYIFSDGVKVDADERQTQQILEVRQIIRAKLWCGKVVLIESERNKGLALSIQEGVTQLTETYGKAIVMEDDLITSPAFLTYMNKALNFYQNRKSVFSISGYCLPPSKLKIPADYAFDVFVSVRNSSWGWATWEDRWDQVDWTVEHYATMQSSIYMQKAFNRGGDDVYEMLVSQQQGKLNIWSIQFTAAHFANHAVSIVPTHSYVDNIGLDGSGENCSVSPGLKNKELNTKQNIQFLEVLYEDPRIINGFYNAYCRKKRPLWQKVANRLSRLLGGENVFQIKGRIYE